MLATMNLDEALVNGKLSKSGVILDATMLKTS